MPWGQTVLKIDLIVFNKTAQWEFIIFWAYAKREETESFFQCDVKTFK